MVRRLEQTLYFRYVNNGKGGDSRLKSTRNSFFSKIVKDVVLHIDFDACMQSMYVTSVWI